MLKHGHSKSLHFIGQDLHRGKRKKKDKEVIFALNICLGKPPKLSQNRPFHTGRKEERENKKKETRPVSSVYITFK